MIITFANFELLQAWVLYKTNNNERYKSDYKHVQVANFEIKSFCLTIEQELYLSMAFALFHTIVEVLILYLESKALKTSMLHYTVVCMNGRFGWIPYTNVMYHWNLTINRIEQAKK